MLTPTRRATGLRRAPGTGGGASGRPARAAFAVALILGLASLAATRDLPSRTLEPHGDGAARGAVDHPRAIGNDERSAAIGIAQRDARTHVVEIRGFAFVPDTVVATAGDTVVWRNHDLVPHTATDVREVWDSGSLPPGAEWRTTVGETADVFCRLHPSMRGRVVMRPE